MFSFQLSAFLSKRNPFFFSNYLKNDKELVEM